MVIGVSPDPLDRLRKFRDKNDLPFVLVSDPDHRVAEMYGVWAEKKMYGKTFMGIVRSHFVIDEQGRTWRLRSGQFARRVSSWVRVGF